jgi:GNAT superfamily N-acetyltransferase
MKIRSAKPEDRAAILDLVRLCLGEGKIPRTEAFWNWKHEENPFGPSPTLVAEDAKGTLIGLRTFLRWEFFTLGQKVHAVRAVDTATHPEHRGKGIFSTLTRQLADEMRDQGVDFIFNTPNDKSRAGYLKLGWKEVGRFPLWVKPLRPTRAGLRKILGRGVPDSDEEAPPADVFLRDELFARPDLGVWLEKMDEPQAGLHTRHNVQTLQWRYVDIPGFAYGADARFEGEHGALAIWRHRRREGLRELAFEEVFTTVGQGGARMGQDLIKGICKRSRAHYALGSSPTESRAGNAFKGAGFIRVPGIGPIFTARPLSHAPGLPVISRWKGWSLSLGDGELF